MKIWILALTAVIYFLAAFVAMEQSFADLEKPVSQSESQGEPSPLEGSDSEEESEKGSGKSSAECEELHPSFVSMGSALSQKVQFFYKAPRGEAIVNRLFKPPKA